MQMDVEKEFAGITAALGGARVSDHVGAAPPFDNADFIFPRDEVVAELKCLDEDKMSDERIIKRASKLYAQEVTSGRAPYVIASGTVEMTTHGFSPDYVRKIVDLFKVPIKRQVKKANTQIKATKEKLGVQNYCGLLIVANNRHSALDPWHGYFILNELMKQEYYGGINGAIYLTANQRAVHSQTQRNVGVWAQIRRPHLPMINANFLSTLREHWLRRLTTFVGETESQEFQIDLEQLTQIENKRT